jgi:hypothetical protein
MMLIATVSPTSFIFNKFSNEAFFKFSKVLKVLANTLAVVSPTCLIPKPIINFSNELFLDS